MAALHKSPAFAAAPKAPSATAQALASFRHAFGAGDFRRARAIATALRAAPQNPPLAPLTQSELVRASRAWSVDPFVWGVGLLTAATYVLAWIYALAQRG